MTKYLGIIPARGGSKGIKNKNMRVIGKKPMIQFSFEAAMNSSKLDSCILTSDDKDIIEFASGFGISTPFVRPSSIAGDETPMVEVIKHALDWHNTAYSHFPKYFVLLCPTSPFRNAEDIDNAIKKREASNRESLVSVCPVSQHPAECVAIGNSGQLEFIEILEMNLQHGRQAYKPFYFIDGAIYICKTSAFYGKFLKKGVIFDEDTDIYIMKSSHSIDINNWFDLHLARALYHYSNNVKGSDFEL